MRKIIAVLLLFALCVLPVTSVSAASSGNYYISINGQLLQHDSPPINRNGAIFVPMRLIFEALNAKVAYESKEQKVIGTSGNSTLEMWVGRTNAKLNGEQFIMQQAPFILNNRVYVPVRVISESLGANVNWNKNTQTVEIGSSLLTHRDQLPIGNDRGQPAVLEHSGNMKLKWSYHDQSSQQIFTGYVVDKDKYFFKGLFKALSIDSSGKIISKEPTTDSKNFIIRALISPRKNGADISSVTSPNNWEGIPVFEEKIGDTSGIVRLVLPKAVIDSSGNLVITTTEGLVAYNPSGEKLWTHREWTIDGKRISALQEPSEMSIDKLDRIYIYYKEGIVVLNQNGSLLSYWGEGNVNFYPTIDGLILTDYGTYELSDKGEFLQTSNLSEIAVADHFNVTQQEIISTGAASTDVKWTYRMPQYEYNKGHSFNKGHLIEDLAGNVYAYTLGGTVHGLNADGKLMFKLVVDNKKDTAMQIIPLSENEIIVICNNSILCFEMS